MKLTFNNNKIKFVNFNQKFKNCIKTKYWFLIMTANLDQHHASVA